MDQFHVHCLWPLLHWHYPPVLAFFSCVCLWKFLGECSQNFITITRTSLLCLIYIPYWLKQVNTYIQMGKAKLFHRENRIASEFSLKFEEELYISSYTICYITLQQIGELSCGATHLNVSIRSSMGQHKMGATLCVNLMCKTQITDMLVHESQYSTTHTHCIPKGK